MKELMAALMVWINAYNGLPIPPDLPQIVRAERCEIERFAYGDASRQCSRYGVGVQAAYDNNRVYLQHTWSASNLRDVALLLHELVHHMQAASGKTFDRVQCPPSELEKPAYETQLAWLRAAGVEPYKVAGINPVSLVFLTSCRSRDPVER